MPCPGRSQQAPGPQLAQPKVQPGFPVLEHLAAQEVGQQQSGRLVLPNLPARRRTQSSTGRGRRRRRARCRRCPPWPAAAGSPGGPTGSGRPGTAPVVMGRYREVVWLVQHRKQRGIQAASLEQHLFGREQGAHAKQRLGGQPAKQAAGHRSAVCSWQHRLWLCMNQPARRKQNVSDQAGREGSQARAWNRRVRSAGSSSVSSRRAT